MESFFKTDRGRVRDTNQDYVYMSESPVGPLPNLFMVADGMGGHNAGDFASKYTVETVEGYLKSRAGTDYKALIKDALDFANNGLLETAGSHPAMNGMGTTSVISVIDKNNLLVANVGDSRAYLKSDGLYQITRDHSLVAEQLRVGVITEDEALERNDKNVITRAVGAFPELETDFFELSVKQGDMLLMCTDGLTNMVSDEEINAVLDSSMSIREMVICLVDKAIRAGGTDNVTVALVRI